jgi:hypothetical protein
MRKHPSVAAGVMGTWQQFLGWNTIALTRSEDPAHIRFVAKFAADLCKMACIPVPEAAIVETVAQLGFTSEDPMRAKVVDAMKRLRDIVSRQIPIT